jgi:hypothetical protein
LHQVGEEATLEIMRKGKISQITLPLTRTQNDFLLVPLEQYDQMPRYFIYGGIVFSPLTKNLIKRWGNEWAPWAREAPIEWMIELSNWPTEERREVVVALQVLAADINRGYHDLYGWVVTEVNGKKFKDFNEFFHLVSASTEPFTVFKDKQGFQVVIDRKKARETHEEILRIYRIEEDRSPDLKSRE